MEKKYILCRSPESVVKEGWVSYGWSKVDFSKFDDFGGLAKEIESQYGGFGRGKKQVKRFFELEKGDIVVVPVTRGIYIGVVEGEKNFIPGEKYPNRVKVSFYPKNGMPIRTPRVQLSNKLSSRLRVRMSVADLEGFKGELSGIVCAIESGEDYNINSNLDNIRVEQEEAFKEQLLKNIQKGQTFLESGGMGLEKLVKELLEIEGFEEVVIKAKNAHKGIADVDIEATKTDKFITHKMLIQVKHHKGITGSKGAKQLDALKVDEDNVILSRWLITTANDVELNEEYENKIYVMKGKEFVDWVYDNLHSLSKETLDTLKVSCIPSLIE